MTERRFLALVVLIGAALTGLFWWPLWTGGGFFGGDIYSYYFPQKVFYAEQLQQGHWPFWNDRVGHGYSALGESQTGMFYPLHLALYSWLPLNTAYSVSHLVHYVLAFVFTVGYARRFGLARVGAVLAGLVYVYGWFPCRSCWEWAIIGGTWLPASLWMVECLLQTRRWRYAGLLAVVLAVQLLAGHFQLAFLTHLLLLAYVPCRLWLVPVAGGPSSPRPRVRAGVVLLGAGVLGFSLSAVQLMPTWEFRKDSQRIEVGPDHDLRFGSIPASFWTQAVMPWRWYLPMSERPRVDGLQTNDGETQLYFGLVPLLLALVGFGDSLRRGDPRGIFWTIVGLVALFYTTGQLVPLVETLPGFSYFQGPGRFGMIVTLAVAILAGEAAGRYLRPETFSSRLAVVVAVVAVGALFSSWWLVDQTFSQVQQAGYDPPPRMPSPQLALVLLIAGGLVALAGNLWSQRKPVEGVGRRVVLGLVLSVSVIDLWLVSRLVQMKLTDMVADPPIVHLEESEITRRLRSEPGPTRIFAPNANFPTVLGTSATPVYFTFGPREYRDPKLAMPQSRVDDPKDSFVPQTDEQMNWLEQAGVTHILSFKPIDATHWPVEEIWRGRDRVMTIVLQHRELLYLYRLTGSRGRAAWVQSDSPNRIMRVESTAGEVTIDVDVTRPGRLVLTELLATGWQVSVDGESRSAERIDGLYRGVTLRPGDSRVRWYYEPAGLYWGLLISVTAAVFLAAIGWVRRRRPEQLAFLDLEEPA